MTDFWGYPATPHRAKYRMAESNEICAVCGWSLSHELHDEAKVLAAAQIPADERETAQWFTLNCQSAEAQKALKPYPEAFRNGSTVAWSQLPEGAQMALGLALQRIRTMTNYKSWRGIAALVDSAPQVSRIFPATMDAKALWDYWSDTHDNLPDPEYMSQACDDSWELRDIPLEPLKPFNYALPASVRPDKVGYPIIVDSSGILDGSHRAAHAYQQGQRTIKAYVPVGMYK